MYIGSIPFSASIAMNILVTGSSGFIGFHLTKSLLLKGHSVTGIDNHNNYYDVSLKKERLKLLGNERFSFWNMDINQLDQLTGNFDIAINLAAQAGVRVKNSQEKFYKHSNIEGFKSFTNFCIKNKVQRIIYASSSSVYSDKSKKKFNETSTELCPKSLYGKSKLINEKLAESISSEGISLIGLRFFSVYGPYGRPDMAYYSFAKSIMQDENITLFNKGMLSRDMTYIDDIVDGVNNSIDYISQQPKGTHEIFNLGNDQPVKTIDLLKLLEKKYNKKAKIIFKESMNESEYTHADISKAKKILGYKPDINFDEGMERFLDWFENYENI